MPALLSALKLSVESQDLQLRTSRSSSRDRVPILLSSFIRHLDCLQFVSSAYVFSHTNLMLAYHWKMFNLVCLLLHQSKLVSMLPQELVELVLSWLQRGIALDTAFLYTCLVIHSYFQFLIPFIFGARVGINGYFILLDSNVIAG